MKIRQKLVVSHSITGIVPIITAFFVLAVIVFTNSRNSVAQSLDSTLEDIVQQIEWESERYRTFSSMIGRTFAFENYMEENTTSWSAPLYLARYNVKIVELFTSNTIRKRDFSDTQYASCISTQDFVDFMWDLLSGPYYHREFMLTYPEILSNNIIMRNIGLYYDPHTEQKTGMVISSFPLDQEYLASLSDNPDLIVFAESDNFATFSDPDCNERKGLFSLITNTNNTGQKNFQLIDIEDRGKFYLFTEQMYTTDDSYVNIGILYGFESVNKFMNLFRNVGLIVFALGVFIAYLIALYLSNRITNPILNLRDMVTEFQKKYIMIPEPSYIKDEISELQLSFSEMSSSIKNYKHQVDSYNEELSREVEEKTRNLRNKVKSLTLITEFSSFTMRSDAMDEKDFMRDVMFQLKNIFQLKYISVMSLASRTPQRIHYLAIDPALNNPEKQRKMNKIEEKLVYRLMGQAEMYAKSLHELTYGCVPIYFIDQMEFAIFYIVETQWKDLVVGTFYTICNLISMKIFSIRLSSEKIQSEKMASLGQFASTIVHDIKNPLTVIKSSVDVLSDDDFTAEEKQEFQEILGTELDMLTDMLNDILDFSKGELHLERSEVDIDQMLTELSKFYNNTLHQKNINLELQLNSKTILYIDRHRVWRALANILSNAIDAIEGQGKITIRSEKKILDVMIVIADNGPGISAEIKKNLFEPFVTYGKRGGTGLGLSIVKKVIESHGGNINFKTKKGEGTRFFITFPL